MLGSICFYIVIFQFLYFVSKWAYKNLFGPFLFGTSLNLKKYGDWAVVTGASDGIGKEFAKQLAARGLNVVLVSRTLKKLEDLASDIEKIHKVQTRIVSVDFSEGLNVYDVIAENIKDLDVGILVNNVGVGPDQNAFHLAQKSYIWDLIACNVISIPFMTQIVIEKMLEKNCGLILNISSLSSMIPVPICLYSATKGYVDKFTEDLALEYGHKGIDIQAFNPGLVKSNMWTLDGGSLMKPDARKYVKSAMKSLGLGTFTFGYVPHAFFYLFLKVSYMLVPQVYGKISRDMWKRN